MDAVGKRTAVVTGASSGIGKACVSRLVSSGWQVFATVRKPADGDRLQAEFGSAAVPVIMDVTERTSISAAAEKVMLLHEGQGLCGLVNVAGVGMMRPLEYLTPNDLRGIFDINVFGQIAVTQAFLPLLRGARGRIVNISSIGAHIAVPFGSPINASKSAFGMFSDTLRLELHPFGMYVSTVEPGAIKTPAVDKTLGEVDSVVAGLPSAAAAQYGEMLKRFAHRAYAREMNGSPPEVVAEAVYHALTARRPRPRYRVGKHSTFLGMLPRILPQRLLDPLMLRVAGMPTGFPARSEQLRCSHTRPSAL